MAAATAVARAVAARAAAAMATGSDMIHRLVRCKIYHFSQCQICSNLNTRHHVHRILFRRIRHTIVCSRCGYSRCRNVGDTVPLPATAATARGAAARATAVAATARGAAATATGAAARVTAAAVTATVG